MNRIALSFLLCIVIPACKNNTQEKEAAPIKTGSDISLNAEQVKRAGIAFGKVGQVEIPETIKVNGQITVPPQYKASVTAILGGFVKSTSIIDGKKVNKGEVLAVLEHPDFIKLQQQYLEDKSRLGFLELEFKRQQELEKEQATTAKKLQEVSAELNAARARLNGTAETLKLIGIIPSTIDAGNIRSEISIKAPVNGYVTSVKINQGVYVNAADVLFEIVDTEHLMAELIVFEKDVTKLKEGQKIELHFASIPGTTKTATIDFIGKNLERDRSVRVSAMLEGEKGGVLPGMYVSAFIETGNRKTSALPSGAIAKNAGRDYIFILRDKNMDNYHFEMLEIKTGFSSDNFVEVLDFPASLENESIAVSGSYYLISAVLNVEEE